MSVTPEMISIREFGRRVGMSDTAVRKKIYHEKDNPTGILVKSIAINNKNGRPEIDAQIALVEWRIAGLPITGTLDMTVTTPVTTSKVDEKAVAKLAKSPENGPETQNLSKDLELYRQFLNLKDKNELVEMLIQTKKEVVGIGDLTITGDMNQQKAKDAVALFSAGIEELKYKKMSGELVSRAEIDFQLMEFGAEIRSSLENIPARTIPRLLAVNTHIAMKNILQKEIEDTLLILSRGPKEFTEDDDDDDDF